MQQHLRLRRRADFERLRREGRAHQHRSRALTLSAAPSDGQENRYGFITGKSLGKAVVRNRVRRRLREAVRLLHPRLHSAYDLVFIARPPLVSKSWSELQQIVYELLVQARLVESDSTAS